MSDVASRLAAAGLSLAEADRKGALFAAAQRAIGTPRQPRRWYVPGRIEVLGKHTDYAGGRSLLCAAERGMCVVAEPRTDSVVRVIDAVLGETREFPLSPHVADPSGWGNYVATVVRRIARNVPDATRGVDVAIASDLPRAAGMSSSSALVVAVFTALAHVNRLCEHGPLADVCAKPETLAEYIGCIENGGSYRGLTGDQGVGVFGGSEDHTAILCCQPACVSRYRFCPVTFEQRVRVPQEWVFVIASSGVSAEKTGAARDRYNRASLAARAVLNVWRATSGRHDENLEMALRDAPGTSDAIRQALATCRHDDFSADELRRRFDQFLLESQTLVPAGASAFASGDARALGEVVERSQAAAERLLGNQIPETVALVRMARQLGALAASAFGAGFGGSVWALVRRAEAARFPREWRALYAISFPEAASRAEIFVTGAGPGLTEL